MRAKEEDRREPNGIEWRLTMCEVAKLSKFGDTVRESKARAKTVHEKLLAVRSKGTRWRGSQLKDPVETLSAKVKRRQKQSTKVIDGPK